MSFHLRDLLLAATILAASLLVAAAAQGQAPPPIDAPEVVHYSKLIPVLPEGPKEWTAEEAEGQTNEDAGFRLTTVHRDYRKGEGDTMPTASISILDSAANPEYVSTTINAWKQASETPDGYSKPVTIDGNPGFESYEKEQKHSALWVMIAKRYLVQVELQNLAPTELQEWVKRIDLKKLAEIK